MKINLMYDISVFGVAMSHMTSRTGIYRVVMELLNELQKSEEINLLLANTAEPVYLKKTKEFLIENGYEQRLNNELVYNLPNKIFGRGKRILRNLYSLLGIDLELIEYNIEAFKKANIFHTPFYKIPDDLKKYSKLKRCITIHDIIPVLYPNLHNKQHETEDIISSIGDDYAICVSENTKNDLLNYDSNIDPDSVFVCHLAADSDKFYPSEDLEKFKEVQSRYGLPENYFLSLCTLEPRKNLERLIRSFNKFVMEHHINDLSLVLVGTKGWQFEKIFEEIDCSKNLKDRIITTGWVFDEDLASIYSHAHSFYYISKYEGFGLPPLEAMQCGVATVTSNTSSLPEVVGNGAIMVDPENNDQICDAMYQIYTDSALKNELETKGLKQSEKFSWCKTTERHLDIYHQILDEK